MTRVIRSYNKTAALLLQYELLHLQTWYQTAESAPRCLSAALLARHEDGKVLVTSQLDEAERGPRTVCDVTRCVFCRGSPSTWTSWCWRFWRRPAG